MNHDINIITIISQVLMHIIIAFILENFMGVSKIVGHSAHHLLIKKVWGIVFMKATIKVNCAHHVPALLIS